MPESVPPGVSSLVTWGGSASASRALQMTSVACAVCADLFQEEEEEEEEEASMTVAERRGSSAARKPAKMKPKRTVKVRAPPLPHLP